MLLKIGIQSLVVLHAEGSRVSWRNLSEPALGWENTHMSVANLCIPSVIRDNHNMWWHLVQLLSPVCG